MAYNLCYNENNLPNKSQKIVGNGDFLNISKMLSKQNRQA